MENTDLIRKAEEFAIKAHESVNHLYDGRPYAIHLKRVVKLVAQYLNPSFVDYEPFLAAAWLHDTIEDCRLTYNDIKEEFGEQVAELVYALTNEKGRNRKERANDKYYEGIRNCPGATIIKVADRIANIEYSKGSGSDMFRKYKKEHEDFCKQLNLDSDTYMVRHMKYLLDLPNRNPIS
jgi:(p)ppGpp synthase/HD superfamily hydrolase